jgi:hypothetical protein
MKKLILITLIIMLSSAAVSAQGRGFRTLYDKYAGRDGYVSVEMSGSMFNVVNGVAEDNSTSGSDFMGKIDNLVIIVARKGDAAFGRDVEALVGGGDYKPMTTIREGGGTVHLYTGRQEAGRASEFLMTVVNSTDYVVMSIVGDGLSVDEVSQIARNTAAQ